MIKKLKGVEHSMKYTVYLILSIIVLFSAYGCSNDKNTTEEVIIENKEAHSQSEKETEELAKSQEEGEGEVVTVSLMEKSEGSRLAYLVLEEAYKRIGITLKNELYPSLRSLEKSNSGETDGETMRIKGIDEKYPNLVMVPEPVYELDFVAVVKDTKFEVNGPESLEPYTLGHENGIIFIEKMVEKINPKSVETVKNGELLIKKIDSGRTEVGIMSRDTAEKTIKETALDVTILEPPLSKLPLYHYLHKDNTHLLEKLSNSLKEMKEDGTWEKIITE
jgi:polar amino acid transport system substrate-binding protein